MHDIHKVAAEACDAIGIEYQNTQMDGKFHPLRCKGKGLRNDAGRVMIFADGMGGVAWNHITSESIKFSVKDWGSLSMSERNELNRQATAAKAEAVQVQAERYKQAAAVAAQVVSVSLQASSANKYLQRKQTPPTANLREISREDLVNIIGYIPKARSEELCTGKILVVPLQDINGHITSIEMIDQDGRKSALAGGKKNGGCFWATDNKLPDGTGDGLSFCIGEGVATVLTASMASGFIGIASGSCGNMPAVAYVIRKRYPNAIIYIIPDKNNGHEKAVEAGNLIKGILIEPQFIPRDEAKGTDLNDMMCFYGIQAVKDHVQLHVDPLSEGNVKLIRGDSITPRKIEWVWDGWLPQGKLVILAGQAGAGKTTIAMTLAAIVTIGGRFPDGTWCDKGSVVIWSGEDDPEDTLVPRLMGAGANMSKVCFVSGMRGSVFDPSKDMGDLCKIVARIPDVKLIVVDPIVSAISGDSHKNAEVRKSLQPLVELGWNTGACTMGISHFNKKGGATVDPIDLMAGSIAFAAVARVVLGAAKLQAPDEHGHSRIFCRIKSNIGPDEDGVGYSLKMQQLLNEPEFDVSTVLWGKYVRGHSRVLLAQSQVVTEKRDTKLEEAKDFALSTLQNGPMATALLTERYEKAGISKATMRRAEKALGLVNYRELGPGGKWMWKLPPEVNSSSTIATCSTLYSKYDEQYEQHEQVDTNGKLLKLPNLSTPIHVDQLSKLPPSPVKIAAEGPLPLNAPEFDWEDE